MRVSKPVTVTPGTDTAFAYVVIEAYQGLMFCMFKSEEQAQLLHDCVLALDGRIDFLPSISPLCNAGTSGHSSSHPPASQ